MSETKKKEEPRAIDDSQVRTQAHLLEIDLDAINFYAGDLREKLEILHKEMEFADPTKDQAFEKFMYKLQRFALTLQSLAELKKLTKAMQKFGMPTDEEVAEMLRIAGREVRGQKPKILITHAQKQLINQGASPCMMRNLNN